MRSSSRTSDTGQSPFRPSPASAQHWNVWNFQSPTTHYVGAASKPPNDGDNLSVLAAPRRCLDVAQSGSAYLFLA